MNLLEKFEKLNNKLSTLLEENKELKQQYKNLQEESQELKEKLDERDYKNLQEENKKLKQHVLNLEKQKNNLQGENKNLKEKLNERDKQFQQHILNLEKQKNEELEIISQNLEKTLGKLELDELNEINENDTKIFKEKNKSLIDKRTLIDDDIDIKDKEYIQYVGDSDPLLSKNKSNQTNRSGYSHSENERSYNSFNKDHVRVVIGLDFGTTYSGFSYRHVNNSNITTNDQWDGNVGMLKTNTVLQYDSNFENVIGWGYPALSKRPSRKKNISETRPVELFKLYLGNLSEGLKPRLPDGFDYKKAITDYLREIGKMIKDTLRKCYQGIDFFEHVLLILTVPAEYSVNAIAIMRECAFKAELTMEKDSTMLQFTTEPEAVAICCIDAIGKDCLIGSNFMVVDCGGGTVDLTTRKLFNNEKLGEITERTGGFCGSTFIDREFIKFLREKLGNYAIDSFSDKHYGQLQYMVQEFCNRIKLPFTGDQIEYRPYMLDIEEIAPALLQYVEGKAKYEMERSDWIIDIEFEDVKKMFDPVVYNIIKLIRSQLSETQEKCSTIFLAGGFSESKYLQKRIKDEFRHVVKKIYVPSSPITTIQRGAVMYGLSLKNGSVISSRVLKYTYGVIERNYWTEKDPIERKLRGGRIDRFHRIIKRGTQVEANQKIRKIFTPLSPMQTRTSFNIYITRQYDAKYCDEPGVELLGNLVVHLPGSSFLDRLLFEFALGEIEITVTVRNETDGTHYETTLNYDD